MPLILSTDRLNSHGFRVLSSGGDFTDFLKNPVLLYDHIRRFIENHDSIILPIGKINNLRSESDLVVGDPEFDQDDEFANKVRKKFDKGYLNAASIGFDVVEWSEDPDLMVPGQSGPTITKWKLKEVSITDIPSNSDAVKLNYKGRTICLNGKSKQEDIDNFFSIHKPIDSAMKKTIAALNATGLVKLPESATDEMVENAVQAIAAQLSAKDSDITKLKGEVKTAQDKVKETETNALQAKATALVENALSAKKIVAGEKDHLIKLASASEEAYKSTDEMLKLRKAYESVNSQVTVPADETEEARVIEFVKLQKENKLATLKATNPERFKQLSESFKNSKKS